MRPKDQEALDILLDLARGLGEVCQDILEDEDSDGDLYNDAFGIQFTVEAWIGHLEALPSGERTMPFAAMVEPSEN